MASQNVPGVIKHVLYMFMYTLNNHILGVANMWSRVASVWNAPSELRNPPDYLIKLGRSGAIRTRASKNAALQPGNCSNTAGRQKRKSAPHTQKRKSANERLSSNSVKNKRHLFTLPDGSVAIMPPSPRAYCKELVDEDRELLLIELKPTVGAKDEEAWLDDEHISHVIVRTNDGTYSVPRSDLRTYVRRVVPISAPTRNLHKALHKMCLPVGSEGPTVTLLSTQEVLNVLTSENHGEWAMYAATISPHPTST